MNKLGIVPEAHSKKSGQLTALYRLQANQTVYPNPSFSNSEFGPIYGTTLNSTCLSDYHPDERVPGNQPKTNHPCIQLDDPSSLPINRDVITVHFAVRCYHAALLSNLQSVCNQCFFRRKCASHRRFVCSADTARRIARWTQLASLGGIAPRQSNNAWSSAAI
jgi:hypothetical protein